MVWFLTFFLSYLCNIGRIGCQVVIPYRGDGYWARELKLAGDLGQIVNYPCDMKDESQVAGSVNHSKHIFITYSFFLLILNYSSLLILYIFVCFF